MSLSHSNGNGKLTYWMLWVLLIFVVLFVIAGWRTIMKEIDLLRERQVIVEERVIKRLEYLEIAIDRLRWAGQPAPPSHKD